MALSELLWKQVSVRPTGLVTLLAVMLLWLSAAGIGLAAALSGPPSPQRIEQIAAMLPQLPSGVGPAISDRRAWQTLARTGMGPRTIKQAEKLVTEPIPELTDELYLDFSRTGNRTRCQRVLSQRHGRISVLVLAECFENHGRFLSSIEEAVRAVCSEKTWVLPAHDRQLSDFEGKTTRIDLAVAGVSWSLATVDYWLGDKLSDPLRTLIRNELERRTFRPLEGMVNKGDPPMYWLRSTSNWNAVCLAGVTGAALAAIEDRHRRAFFVASAERYIQNFLAGFTDDGYCSEGIGYWNYGFGHFVLLAEAVHQATGGALDMLAYPKVKPITTFGRRIEILGGVYPAFADCSPRSRPGVSIMAHVSRRLGLGWTELERQARASVGRRSSHLPDLALLAWPALQAASTGTAEHSPRSLRDWFSDAGILICRPARDDARALGVALKGGHNAEHHNHNDVGTFVVARGGGAPLMDLGSETYTARTFSKDRYQSRALNSFGHPVPVVAGQLQRTGRAAAAKVLKADFSDPVDTLVLDLRAAYAVKGLKKLERTFIYDRKDHGRLTVVDDVELDRPQSFATALTTASPWRRDGANRLLVGEGQQAVRVEITTDTEWKLEPVTIEEDLHLSHGQVATRLGISLARPVDRATITIAIE